MKKSVAIVCGVGAVFALSAAFEFGALAQSAPATNSLYYAGILTEAGQPVTGDRVLTINVWPDATSAGAPLCSTVASSPPVSVVGGQFRLPLSGACAAVFVANSGAYVEVVDGATSLGRTPIGAVPYAVTSLHASNADTATNAGHAATADTATAASHAATADTATTAQGAASLSPGASGGLRSFTVNGNALVGPCALAAGLSASVDCTCPNGSYVVGGGGWVFGPSFLRESRPIGTTAWRVTCSSGTSDVLCGQYSLTCSSLGP